MSHEKFVGYAEATEFVSQLKDPVVRSFVQYGLTNAISGRRMEPSLQGEAPWDLRWLCEVLKAMAENRAAIEALLAGKPEKLGLFSDD